MKKVDAELINDVVASTNESFGGAGEDAVTAALTEARVGASGWDSFMRKFLANLEGRLLVLPKAAIDLSGILALVGDWFDKIVGPMHFDWILDSIEDQVKLLMKNALLMGVEFVINKILGK